MKKLPIYSLLFLFMVAISCQKENKADLKPNETTISNHENGFGSLQLAELLFSGPLNQFERIAGEEKETIRELTPYERLRGEKCFRYKITELNKTGDILNSGYIISLSKLDQKKILFSLPVSKTEVIYREILPMVTQSANPARAVKIIGKTKGKGYDLSAPVSKVLNTALPCSEIPPVCIDWFWTTYDPITGAIISEVYLYTSCTDPCANGGGGGSGNPPPTENCDAAYAKLQGVPVSVEEDVTLLEGNPTIRTKLYSWTFYKQNQDLWSFRSHETGVHKKQSNGKWIWQSLTHTSITRAGTTIGGYVNCNLISAIPEVGLYWAGMQLAYNIESNLICNSSPLSHNSENKSKSPIWNVDYIPTN